MDIELFVHLVYLRPQEHLELILNEMKICNMCELVLNFIMEKLDEFTTNLTMAYEKDRFTYI
jgi:hypothetical protein